MNPISAPSAQSNLPSVAVTKRRATLLPFLMFALVKIVALASSSFFSLVATQLSVAFFVITTSVLLACLQLKKIGSRERFVLTYQARAAQDLCVFMKDYCVSPDLGGFVSVVACIMII